MTQLNRRQRKTPPPQTHRQASGFAQRGRLVAKEHGKRRLGIKRGI